VDALRAILPNPARAVLTRVRMERGEGEMRARFASVLDAARMADPAAGAGPAAGTGPEEAVETPESRLSEEDQAFLAEVDRLRDLAQELESFLYMRALSAMRKTLNPKDNILHGGPAEDTYSMLLDVERAKSMGGPEGSGLAESITQNSLTWSQRQRLEEIEGRLARQELKRSTEGPK